MAQSLRISILHNIFLDRDQRIYLAKHQNVELRTTGVSLPVWYHVKKGRKKREIKTNEPAQEVFCHYLISNLKSNEVVKVLNDGYKIHLPINDLKKLLDIKDGGSEQLIFRNYSFIEHDQERYRASHYIVLKSLEDLSSTIV